MNVKLVAQALSSTVCKILRSYVPPEAAGTAKFCLLMGSFFDIMNIRDIPSHKLKENHSLIVLLQLTRNLKSFKIS